MRISEINIIGNQISYRMNGTLSQTFMDCLEFEEFGTQEDIVDSGYGNWERHHVQEVKVKLDFEDLDFETQCEVLIENHQDENELESPLRPSEIYLFQLLLESPKLEFEDNGNKVSIEKYANGSVTVWWKTPNESRKVEFEDNILEAIRLFETKKAPLQEAYLELV